MSDAAVAVLDRLQRRCAELEDELARERHLKNAQHSDNHQQQIDDLVFQYEQRLQVLEDEKREVTFLLHQSVYSGMS
jgi:HPt (histidine-containing phosphotransfer) domain-containing protein